MQVRRSPALPLAVVGGVLIFGAAFAVTLALVLSGEESAEPYPSLVRAGATAEPTGPVGPIEPLGPTGSSGPPGSPGVPLPIAPPGDADRPSFDPSIPKMPKVLDLDAKTAQDLLADLGFEVVFDTDDGRPVDDPADWIVIDQNPGPGVTLKPEEPVFLHVKHKDTSTSGAGS